MIPSLIEIKILVKRPILRTLGNKGLSLSNQYNTLKSKILIIVNTKYLNKLLLNYIFILIE